MIKNKKVFIFFLLLCLNVSAQEISYLGRSPRALLMGDAFTAVADDEFTLFYNVASLARNTGLTLTPLNPSFEFTNPLGDLDRFKNFPSNDTQGIVDRLLGFPVYLKASAFPGLKMSSFGFSLFASSSNSFVIRNATHPTLNLKSALNRGFIAGYSHSFGDGAVKQDGGYTPGQRTSFGMSVKHYNTEGIDGNFDIFGTGLLSAVTSGIGGLSDLKSALGSAKGSGWGFDFGFEYMVSSRFSQLSFGASILDAGGTSFEKTGGVGDVPSQDMLINAGAAFRQDFGIIDYTVALDLHPIQTGMSLIRMVHVGMELNIPFLSIYGGYSEGYPSYGVGFNLWPFKVYMGLYSVELGTELRQEQGKRAVFSLNLFDIEFDAI